MTPLDEGSLRRCLQRYQPQLKPRNDSTRLASVAIILRYENPGQGPEVLFIKRASHPRDPWSGHMAFPGGRQQADDADELAAAIRETQEEVGLALRPGTSLAGRIDDCQAIARGGLLDMVITPFVFLLNTPHRLQLQVDEVTSAHWFSVQTLLSGRCDAEKTYRRGDHSYRLPAWQVQGETVWGLTYTMMQSFFDVLRSAP